VGAVVACAWRASFGGYLLSTKPASVKFASLEKNEVPRSTSFRWASDPEVRREAEATRRRALGRAIGRLSSVALKAADGIVMLAKEAESESVQLRAWRAILADQMAVSKFSDLEYRMAEIEEQLSERTGHTDQAR
jgi:hypothetical protein